MRRTHTHTQNKTKRKNKEGTRHVLSYVKVVNCRELIRQFNSENVSTLPSKKQFYIHTLKKRNTYIHTYIHICVYIMQIHIQSVSRNTYIHTNIAQEE